MWQKYGLPSRVINMGTCDFDQRCKFNLTCFVPILRILPISVFAHCAEVKIWCSLLSVYTFSKDQ